MGCHKLRVSFRKRATKYRALLRKETHEDTASNASSPCCSKMQVSFCKRATSHRALLWNMTYTFKASNESWPLCCKSASENVYLGKVMAHKELGKLIRQVGLDTVVALPPARCAMPDPCQDVPHLCVLRCVVVCCGVLQRQVGLGYRHVRCGVLQCVEIGTYQEVPRCDMLDLTA